MDPVWKKIKHKDGVVKAIYQGKFEWGNSAQGKSECELRVYENKQSNQMIAVVSKADQIKGWNNPTSFIALANAVRDKLEYPPEDNTIWIEYFPQSSGYSESFDLVSLKWEGNSFHSPQRRRILRNQAEELAGSVIKMA